MAAFYVFASCRFGSHDTCVQVIKAPPGVIGGHICACECHKKQVEEKAKEVGHS